MVYKKYIKRGGKIFGPYYYESYRDENGNVKTRFISGPTKKDKTKTRKLPYKNLILIFMVFAIFSFFLFGNLKYFGITGKVISSFYDPGISAEIARNITVSNVDVREVINLELKQPIPKGNKVMEFDAPEGKITLFFNLLDYNTFVKTGREREVEAGSFDIYIRESAEKYKWGYQVKLKDLNFMAKIDVTSQENIEVIDKQTLKIGSNYLSFADLVDAGYFLNFNRPVILGEIDLTKKNITEIDGSPTYVGGSPAYVDGSPTYIDGSPAYVEPSDEPSEEPKGSPDYVTGDIIKSITGFFVRGIEGLVRFIIHGIRGITGLIIVQENQVSIYIERDFTNVSEVEDIIYLDPSLIRIITEEEIEMEKPIRKKIDEIEEECILDWVCEEWSECETVYNLDDLIEGRIFLREEQVQYCYDKNRCMDDKIIRKSCEKVIPAIVKKVVRCFKTYVEIYDENEGILISRLELIDGAFRKLNIQLLLAGEYCPYCYDGIKNYDEDDIDCVYTKGGNCPVCKEEFPELRPFPPILIILIVLILLCPSLITWYLFLEKRTRGGVGERVIREESSLAEKEMIKDFAVFAKKVKRSKKIEAELDSLDTTGFEREVSSIKTKLKDTSLLSQTKKEFKNLKKKLRGKRK